MRRSPLYRLAALAAVTALCGPAAAQDAPKPETLDELLEAVKAGFQAERTEDRQRQREFLASRDRQRELLEEAQATLASEEEASQQLELTYNDNEGEIGETEARLAERLGQMGELFGVVRQVANDLRGQVWESLISSQLGPRAELLDRLGRARELPTTEDLEKLWFQLQQEITQQSKVVRYGASVLTLGGTNDRRQVTRAGPFAVVSEGEYLLWESKDQQLVELPRQPPAQYTETVAPFEAASSGYASLALDPTQGTLLNALLETPSWAERIQQGGFVGAVIIGLGSVAFLLGVILWLRILVTSRKVAAQRQRDEARDDNPLGRVLRVYRGLEQADVETLELKLDEQVLRESSRLERLQWLVRTVSVIAPLLGLLGTVTGMIQTFQAITLFGAGDPKMMAGGISEALVTTMLGLITAIPLVLLADALSNATRRITDTLDEQTAGLIALRAEQNDAGL